MRHTSAGMWMKAELLLNLGSEPCSMNMCQEKVCRCRNKYFKRLKFALGRFYMI